MSFKKPVIVISVVCVIVCFLVAILIINNINNNNADSADTPKALHQITFYGLNGNVIEQKTVKDGSNIIPPEAPYVEGFIFKRWDKPLINISSDLEYYALYDEINMPSISVENVCASASDKTISVNVYLLNNPGLSSVLYNLYYDSKLKIKNIKFASEFGDYITAPEPYSNPQIISLISPMKDIEHSGLMATLTFEIMETPVDDCTLFQIDVMSNKDNTFNSDYKDVTINNLSGSVTIIKEN